MKPAIIASETHRIGAGFSCTFSYDPPQLRCEWAPRLPTAAEFRLIETGYYRARAVFLEGLATQLGGPVVCVEVRR
jgi:hypothetical protein